MTENEAFPLGNRTRARRAHFKTAASLAVLTSCALAATQPAFAQETASNAAKPQDATPAPSQPAPDNGQDAMANDIVVTGTLFRRTDTETPSPVTSLSAQTLEQRGLTTIADAINTISAGNGGSVPQGFMNAFASGAQGVSLRGLTVNSSLILFDGLRPAYYPLADDGQRSFADLNTIPSAIVDRVEVLRDGASSTYGADAVGGVVNVIMKKEITGIQGRLEGGVSQRGDGGGQRVQLTAGYGKLSEQGWNIYISGEYQHQDSIRARDRGFPLNTNNLSSIDAGNGFTGANGDVDFLPPSVSSASSTTVAVVRPANQITPGNILSGVAIAGGQYQILGRTDCGTGLTTRTNSAGRYCEEDQVNKYALLTPDQTRFGGTARLTVNVGSNAQAYLAGTFYESIIFQKRPPSSLRSNNPVFTYGLVLPSHLSNGSLNPQDPYAAAGQAAMIFYSFGDIPSALKNTSQTYRIAGGIDGKFGDGGGWSYSLNGSYMRTNLTQDRTGNINLAGLTKAINDGTYNFINPSSNSQAIRDQISPEQQSKAHSETGEIQGVVTHDLFQLPGGPLSLGVGGEFRYENIFDPTPNPGNQFLTINAFTAIGHRYISSAFYEVQAPVLNTLELNASGRYDHYSIGFDHFSPKFGFKFKPIKQLAIRGTYSEGFRAPSVPETSGNVVGFVNYTPNSTVSAAHGNNAYVLPYALGLNSVGNPNLKPETSRSFTFGTVFQPVHSISLTIDYYNIRKKNVIYSPADSTFATTYLGNGVTAGALPPGITVTLNPADPDHPNLLATPLFVNAAYQNGQSLKTSGIDAQLQATFHLGPNVKWTTNLEGTEVLEYKQINADGSIYDYLGTLGSYNVTSASGTPRWRATWQNTLEVGPWAVSLTGYYTSGYRGWAADYAGVGSCGAGATPESSVKYNADGTARTLGPALQCTVKHFLSFDLNTSVKVGDRFTFYANVANLFDAKAPFDPNTYGGNNYNPAWAASGAIGRYFKAGATFKF